MPLKPPASFPKTAREFDSWCLRTFDTFLQRGEGTPEGNVTANIGTLYCRTDGSTGTTLYVKESGTGNTGWVAK